MTASKFPDLNEITSIAGKLFTDIKRSVTEIVHEYQEKRSSDVNSDTTPGAPSQKASKQGDTPPKSDTKKDPEENS